MIPKRYTVKETSATMRVSTRTVWRLISAGELRITRVGRRVLVYESSIEKYITDHNEERPRLRRVS